MHFYFVLMEDVIPELKAVPIEEYIEDVADVGIKTGTVNA